MTKVYACLMGNWVCLNDDPDCKIGENRVSPSQWWEEGAQIWNPAKPEKEHTLYQTPYTKIIYKGMGYRINPMFLQIVTEQ